MSEPTELTKRCCGWAVLCDTGSGWSVGIDRSGQAMIYAECAQMQAEEVAHKEAHERNIEIGEMFWRVARVRIVLDPES